MGEHLSTGLRAPVLYEQGASLAAVNSEVKALLLGIASIQGGNTSVSQLHEQMVACGATEHFAYAMTHTREPLKAIDPLIGTYETTSDTFHLTDRGHIVAGLGGALLKRFSIAPDTTGSISQIVGFSKRTEGQTVYPAPLTRLLILRRLLSANGNGLPAKDMIDVASTFGITEESVRNHIRRLEQHKAVENFNGRKGIKILTPQGRKNSSALVGTVDSFISNPEETRLEGGEYLQKILAIGRSGDIPYLVKKSISGSGKQDSPALLAFNATVYALLGGNRPMTTAEIARELGMETGRVHHNLVRMTRNLGTASCVALVSGGGVKGVEQIWSFRKPIQR